MPIAAPKYGFPPNFFVAEKPKRIGRKVNGAFANRLIIAAKSANCGYIKINDCPSKKFAVKILLIPINKPPATIAGMIGTKISLSSLTAR